MTRSLCRSMLLLGIGLSFACSKSNGHSEPADATGGKTGSLGGDAGSGDAGSGDAGGSGAGVESHAGGVAGMGGAGNGVGGATHWTSTPIAGAASNCAPITNRVTPVPPMLMFQIDITESMALTTPMTGGQSKWAGTKAALASALRRLPGDWLVGVTFFNKAGTCYGADQQITVPIARLDAAQQSAIATAVDAQHLGGNTPTYCAWKTAAAEILGYRPAAESLYAQSQRYIVLVTDGVPTVNRDCCSLGTSPGGSIAIAQDEYDYLVASIAAETAEKGLRTFVIGVPGSEDPQGAEYDPKCMLSAMAEAGGTASPLDCTSKPGAGACSLRSPNQYCHVDLSTTSDFAAALEEVIVNQIGHSVTSCSYPVPVLEGDNYVDVKRTSVWYGSKAGATPVRLDLASSPACEDGDFYFATDTRGRATMVNLCPTRCTELQKNPEAGLSVQFSCVTIG